MGLCNDVICNPKICVKQQGEKEVYMSFLHGRRQFCRNMYMIVPQSSSWIDCLILCEYVYAYLIVDRRVIHSTAPLFPIFSRRKGKKVIVIQILHSFVVCDYLLNKPVASPFMTMSLVLLSLRIICKASSTNLSVNSLKSEPLKIELFCINAGQVSAQSKFFSFFFNPAKGLGP